MLRSAGSQLPLDWNQAFAGIQPLLLKGLLSPQTEPATIKLLSRVIVSRADAIVDPTDGRLLFAVLGCLPYLMANAHEIDLAHLSYKVAANVAAAADVSNQPNIAKWFRGMHPAPHPTAVF